MLCSIIHIIYICKSDFECICCPNGVAVATNEEHLSGYLVEPLDLPQTPGQIEIEVAGLNSDRSLDFHVFTRVKMANREPPGVMANLERRYAGVQDNTIHGSKMYRADHQSFALLQGFIFLSLNLKNVHTPKVTH